MRQKNKQYQGILAIHKPSGMISKDVSRWLTRRLGKQKIGHVGTLDPLAEGVLPILFGRATRFQDHLLKHPKTYEVELTFGKATDTLDLDGKVIAEKEYDHINESLIKEKLTQFVGEIKQTPPLFSAVKFRGKPLYEYAREGLSDLVPIEELARQVEVFSLELLWLKGNKGYFRVTCGKGTYIRVLVHDLAESLGSCGFVSRLIRTRSSGISINDSLTLESIEESISDLDSLLIPMEKADLGFPQWQSKDHGWVLKLQSGQELNLDPKDFETSLLQNCDVTKADGVDKQLILMLDTEGKAFGLGRAQPNRFNRITIGMKRGL